MERSPELEALLRRMFKALYVDHDAVAMQNLARGSSDPRNRRILVAADEVYQGVGTDYDGVAMVARTEQIGTTAIEYELLEAYEHGDVGWTAAILSIQLKSGELRHSRFTGTFVIEEGMWRNVQWHASLGVPNADAWGVELVEDLAELVASLDASADAAIAATSGTGTVTLLFSDVEDSTSLTEAAGDAEWALTIRRHLKSVKSAVERHNGTLVKTLGDGAMASFGSVTDALRCALELQDLVTDSPFKIRIGVHTGDAIQADGDYIGTTVNKAARIASAAEPGEIVVSSVTAEIAAGHGFELGTNRSVKLKGLAGTHRVTQLIGHP